MNNKHGLDFMEVRGVAIRNGIVICDDENPDHPTPKELYRFACDVVDMYLQNKREKAAKKLDKELL